MIFDGTAGIVVRSFDEGNESAQLVLGDSVIVTGGMTDFNGVLQIEESPITIEVISQNASLPAPQIVKMSDISEDYESELVRIDSVEIDDDGVFERGNYTLIDNNESITLRIGSTTHPLVGREIPDNSVSLTGYVGQSGSEYQLFLRDESDIEIIEDALGIKISENSNLIYPNPVRTSFQIKNPYGKNESVLDLEIFDLNGQIVKKLDVQSEFHTVRDLENGMYILVVNFQDEALYSRLIIKH